MNIRDLFKDDDAVSPVIGVILMVAITVILAAVIGAFVLNIGGSQESSPQVTWEWTDDTSANKTLLKHGGGDKVTNPSQISVTTSDASSNTQIDDTTLDSAFSDTITAGQEDTVLTSSDSNAISGTVELVWESSDGSDTQIISTHEYDTSS